MITIATEVGKYYFTDFISLGSNESAVIDEKLLVLGQLKSLRNAYKTDRLIVSSGDKLKVEAEIESKSQTGGGGNVKSVQGEIGDVVLDATEIDLTTGGSIEEKFGELSPVAFTGSYLDLTNRLGGTGEPFAVIPWNPYREELTEVAFTAANSSTSYSTGHISKKALESVETHLIDVGYPNSPAIVVTNGTNGSLTNIAFNVDASSMLTKTMALTEISSIAIRPVDVFAHDGNTKGATVSFFIIQLDEGEDITAMTVPQITGKTHSIQVNMSNIYQNEYNGYTQLNYSILANGQSVASNTYPCNGMYETLSFKIDHNIFTIGPGWGASTLTDFGFDPNKKYAAIFILQADSNQFDVKTPFNLTVSHLAQEPMVSNVIPDVVNMKIHKNAMINIGFEGDPNLTTDYFGLSLCESEGDLNYYTPNNQLAITSDYIDADGYVYFNVDGSDFKLKNVNTDQFVTLFTRTQDLLVSNIYTRGDQEDWYFEITNWQKRLILDGILPPNVIDGSVLQITHSGSFAGQPLQVSDYIQIYDNKTKFILNRRLDVDAVVNAKIPTLAGEGLKYEEDKLALKLASTSGLEYINNGELKVIDNFNNKYFSYPVLFNRMYEQAIVSNQSSSLSLDLSSNVNIYVYKLYPFGQNSFSYVNLDTNAFGMAFAMCKTVTMLFTDITAQSYITWPSQFLWANGEVPELVPNQKILVTGIVIGTQWESHTDNKLLCTYSTF